MIKNKHIILGGSGFVGNHLLDSLKDDLVICLDKKKNIKRKNKNFHFYQVDLSNEKKTNSCFKKIISKHNLSSIDHLWHLAANSDISKGSKDPKIDLRDTFLTTYYTLNFLKKKIKINNIIFASSSAVYGEKKKKINEIDTLDPISYYGSFKGCSELFLKSFCDLNRIKLLILRFPNVIGSNMTHGLLYDLNKKVKKYKKKIPLLGNGQQKKQYMLVTDLIEIIYFILKKKGEQISVYNLGPSDSGIKVSQIVNEFIKIKNIKSKPVYEKKSIGWPGDIKTFKFDISKLTNLGWKKKITSRNAVIETIKLL